MCYIVCILNTAEDVVVSDTTTSSAVISWRIPSFIEQEEYYVLYGTDPENLNLTSASLLSPEDTTMTDLTYSITLTGMRAGIVYYFRVVAVYDEDIVRYTESLFLTREPGWLLFMNY